MKHTFEPDENKHEIKIGRFYADIQNDSGIFEIQTRSFNALRKKLSFFLENNIVTVIYPIPHQKWLVWIDNDFGQISKKRKSPKVGTVYQAFFELYKIKQLLVHPNLRLCLVFLDITEYRNLDGWSNDRKKGSSRYERIPEKVIDMMYINNPNEYSKLIPDDLPEEFTVKDFKIASKLNIHNAQTALNVLKYVGAVEQTGKKGNAFVYQEIKDIKKHNEILSPSFNVKIMEIKFK